MPIKSVAEALCEATLQLLEESSDVFVIGEGLGDRKRAFGTVPEHPRVFDSPVSENGITGVCIGAAVAGMRPIHVHMRADFLLYAADQIINNAAKWWGMFGGRAGNCPLVIRAVVGRGWGQGMQHSQHLEQWFADVPGLTVVCPSNAFDAKGMLIWASRQRNPVLFFEHRWTHELQCEVPDEPYEVFPAAKMLRGGLAHIGAWGYLVHECLRAANFLEPLGVSVGVWDLQRPRRQHEFDFCRIVSEGSCCPPSPALSRSFYPTALSIAEDICRIQNVQLDLTPLAEVGEHDIPNPNFRGPF